MVPGIRLSEMYYIMGEYFARKGEYSQAGKMLDEVRYARGILTTNMENSIGSLEGFHTELLKDMRKEFVGEGQMFFNTNVWIRNRQIMQSLYLINRIMKMFNV